MTRLEMESILEQSNLPIGDVGFRFIKKFGKHYFSGKVVKIIQNEKRVCKFNDGEHKQY